MSSVFFRFPYKEKFTKNYGTISDPRIVIFIKTIFGFEPVTFLVDTGADISMLPRSWAKRLGIDLKELPSHSILVASGKEMKVYRSRMVVKFDESLEEFTIPCTFTSSDKTPLLLGRVGIFETFTLEFSHHDKTLSFKK